MRRREVLAGVAGSAFLGDTRASVTGLDTRGLADSSRQINDALRKSKSVQLPTGIFRVESEPLILKSGQRLMGSAGTVLLKSSAPDMPLIKTEQSSFVAISDLSLVNVHRDVRTLSVKPSTSPQIISIDIPMAWNWPGITIAATSESGEKRFLHYLQDFRVRWDGQRIIAEVASRAVPPSGALIEYYVQPGLSPLVAVEDSVNVTIERLTLQDGAIAYLASRPLHAALAISRCQISNGQIRIQGRRNTVPQFVDQATSHYLDGPREIRIFGNRITGPFVGAEKRRYIKFTERVHGIVIAGGASGIDVRDNEVSGAAGDGLFLQSAVGGTVRNNKLVGNALSGIGLENISVRRSRNLQVVGNVSNENWFDGCDLNYGDPQVMDCSQVSSVPRGERAEHYIADNEFVANGGDMPELSGGCGIYVRWARSAIIERNSCDDNNISGILCELSENIEIRNNRLGGNGKTGRLSAKAGLGVGLFGCRSAVVEGNRFAEGGRQRAGLLSLPWNGRCKGQVHPIELASIEPERRSRL